MVFAKGGLGVKGRVMNLSSKLLIDISAAGAIALTTPTMLSLRRSFPLARHGFYPMLR